MGCGINVLYKDILCRNKFKNKIMYSLDCSYFKEEFESINDLVEHCTVNGMDPNYEITENGDGIGEELIDYMVF